MSSSSRKRKQAAAASAPGDDSQHVAADAKRPHCRSDGGRDRPLVVCFSGFKLSSASSKPDTPDNFLYMLRSLGCVFSNDMKLAARRSGGHRDRGEGIEEEDEEEDEEGAVSVLVVAKVGSPKHAAALDHGVPCVTIDWLRDSFAQGVVLPLPPPVPRPSRQAGTAAAPAATRADRSTYSVPPFFGLRVGITHLNSQRKNEVRGLLEGGGGGYVASIVASTTSVSVTHLVADAQTVAEYAAWLELRGSSDAGAGAGAGVGSAEEGEALARGMEKAVRIARYNAVKAPGGSSAPPHASTPPAVWIVSARWVEDCVEQSRWLPEQGYAIAIQPTVIAARASTSSSAATTGATPAGPVPLPARLLYNDIDFHELPSLPAAKLALTQPLPLGAAVVYLCGFRDLRTVDYLVRLVTLGGGLRSPVLTPAVTAFIVGPNVEPSHLSRIKHYHPLRPPALLSVFQLLRLVVSPAAADLLVDAVRRSEGDGGTGAALGDREGEEGGGPGLVKSSAVHSAPKEAQSVYSSSATSERKQERTVRARRLFGLAAHAVR